MKSDMAEVKLAKLCIELMQERFKDEGSHKGDVIVGVKLVGNGVQPVYKTGPKKKLPVVLKPGQRPARRVRHPNGGRDHQLPGHVQCVVGRERGLAPHG